MKPFLSRCCSKPGGVVEVRPWVAPYFDSFNFLSLFSTKSDIKIGAVGAQFWSVCVPCLRSAENFSTPEYSDMARDAIEQIEMTIRLVESYPDVFSLIKEPEDVKRVYKEGRIACSIGIEGYVTTIFVKRCG
jgi:hypothetical protein